MEHLADRKDPLVKLGAFGALRNYLQLQADHEWLLSEMDLYYHIVCPLVGPEDMDADVSLPDSLSRHYVNHMYAYTVIHSYDRLFSRISPDVTGIFLSKFGYSDKAGWGRFLVDGQGEQRIEAEFQSLGMYSQTLLTELNVLGQGWNARQRRGSHR